MPHFDFGAAYTAARADHVGEPITFSIGEQQFTCRAPFPVMAVADFLLREDTLDSRMGFLRAVVVEKDWEPLLDALRSMDPALDRDGLYDLIVGILQTGAGRPTSPSGASVSTQSPDGTTSNGDASTEGSTSSASASDASAESPTP